MAFLPTFVERFSLTTIQRVTSTSFWIGRRNTLAWDKGLSSSKLPARTLGFLTSGEERTAAALIVPGLYCGLMRLLASRRRVSLRIKRNLVNLLVLWLKRSRAIFSHTVLGLCRLITLRLQAVTG